MAARAVCCLFVLISACGRAPASSPQIRLETSNPESAVIEVTGVSRPNLAALSSARLTDDEWSAVLRVSVQQTPPAPGMAGRYDVGESVRFTPRFRLDPGRQYEVVFDTSRAPRTGGLHMPVSTAIVSLPSTSQPQSTVVTALYPSGDVVPANLLRMYVQFSGPMGQQGGLDHIVLLDDAGGEIQGAMLPLDTELWSADRTRFTVFFDPGRVKRDILPNRQMGRPLRAGADITVVVKQTWPDGRGVPLKSEFRHRFRVREADERPLDTAQWKIVTPAPGTRDALVVSFPEPLDHGLLRRSLGVAHGGTAVAGEQRIDVAETRWAFVPGEAWLSGSYTLVVQPILEDLAGNRIGRSFEVTQPLGEGTAESAGPTAIPFRISGG